MAENEVRPYPLWKVILGRALLAAFIAFAFDWVGPPLLSVLCLGALLLAGLDRLRRRPDVRAGLLKAGIYGLGALVAFALLASRRADDQAAADQVIAALEQYQQRHGAYPEALRQLAPELLAQVPRTRNSPFIYSPAAAGYRLSYVDMPPGGSRRYSSADRTWESRAD